MKAYADYLIKQGAELSYIEAMEEGADVRVLIKQLAEQGYTEIHLLDPCDDWLMKRIQRACMEAKLEMRVLDSPMFLNTRAELESYFHQSKKKFFQTDFYKQQRIARKILIDADQKPFGGQWTYDVDNRKKYPKGKKTPEVKFPDANSYYTEAIAYTEKYFPNNLGSLNSEFRYPITFEESKTWLQEFIAQRFQEFGVYEDAILREESILHHSVLSPMLNVGLITPQEVLDECIAKANAHNIPLNSLEGFVRQVLGWREFIRGVYVAKGVEERTKNYWKFHRKIPTSFYDGTTGIAPIDQTIKKILKTGYAHHIERLMILGNFMLLCEFDPDEVYRWFMELFIDAYDWVMVPNVYGMSQFADGGLMSTKPYISGSNYLMKMSDYPKGEWQEIWDALFWRFMDKHREFFLKNPRMGMLVRSFDSWELEKREVLLKKAEAYLDFKF